VLKVLLVVAILGAAVYLTVRLVERRGLPRPKPRPQPRVIGPDDDLDFLRDLDFENRRKRKRHPDPPEEPEQPA
jgi:hypothetical protein